jgi:hypothetical protein
MAFFSGIPKSYPPILARPQFLSGLPLTSTRHRSSVHEDDSHANSDVLIVMAVEIGTSELPALLAV